MALFRCGGSKGNLKATAIGNSQTQTTFATTPGHIYGFTFGVEGVTASFTGGTVLFMVSGGGPSRTYLVRATSNSVTITQSTGAGSVGCGVFEIEVE